MRHLQFLVSILLCNHAHLVGIVWYKSSIGDFTSADDISLQTMAAWDCIMVIPLSDHMGWCNNQQGHVLIGSHKSYSFLCLWEGCEHQLMQAPPTFYDFYWEKKDTLRKQTSINTCKLTLLVMFDRFHNIMVSYILVLHIKTQATH